MIGDPLDAAMALLAGTDHITATEFTADDVAKRMGVIRCTAMRHLMAQVDAGTMATRMARSKGKIVRAFRVV